MYGDTNCTRASKSHTRNLGTRLGGRALGGPRETEGWPEDTGGE